jgi:hypothetical protein
VGSSGGADVLVVNVLCTAHESIAKRSPATSTVSASVSSVMVVRETVPPRFRQSVRERVAV